MSEHQCRMVTQDGQQCSRYASPGGLGFCWQHVPVRNKADREKWKLRIEGVALVLSAAEVLLKIIELAVEHCHELFGPGDDQTRAKHKLEHELDLGARFPSLPASYEPGARVDWKGLLQLFEQARRAANAPGGIAVEKLEGGFDQWFQRLNDYHKGELLRTIARDAE